MKDEHFSAAEWEPGDPVDLEHLRHCRECAGSWEMRKFLDFQLKGQTAPEPPPFFASRVAHLAFDQVESSWSLLERAARQLIPLFSTAALLALGLLFLRSPGDEVDPLANLLIEPEESALTVDDVILSLPAEEPDR